MPGISVIMGVYNAEETVAKAIDSILAQTYSDFEFIVCDDGSTDGTRNIIASYAEKDPRIVGLSNDTNLGLAATLNKCLSVCSSPLVARQDADDISYPDRFQLQFDYLEKWPAVDVVGTSADLSVGGEVWGGMSFPESVAPKKWLRGTQIIHASVIMRRRALERVGGYNPLQIRVEDLDLWYRLMLDGAVIRNMPGRLYSITWGRSDYRRKRASDRWMEFKVKLNFARSIKSGFYGYAASVKPVLLMLLPPFFIYLWHRLRFKS